MSSKLDSFRFLEEDPETFLENIDPSYLEELVLYARKKYYSSTNPIISDSLYDLLIQKLQDLKPDSEILLVPEEEPVENEELEIDSVSSDDSIVEGSPFKTKLPFHMGSMNKMKPGDDLENWRETYSGPYIISDKLDGRSALYLPKQKKIFARGPKMIGRDISHILEHIQIPRSEKLPNMAVAGELIISVEDFEPYKKTQENLQGMKNPRNMVTGITNAKKASRKQLNLVQFVAYDIRNDSRSISEKLSDLQNYGFKVVYYEKFEDKLKEKKLKNILVRRRKESEFEIDGIIVAENKEHQYPSEGNPEYSFAFKDNSLLQTARIKVIGVEWNISKDGYIKPTILLEPTEISGITMRKTTGFNAKYIFDNGIGPGAILKMVRSGDVIPHILKVKKSVEPDMPDIPSEWSKNNVDLIAVEGEESDRQRLIKNIIFFLKKSGVMFIDEGLVTKIVENLEVQSLSEFLKIKTKKLLKLEGFGEKLAKKVRKEIKEALKNAKLITMMVASNKFGRGLSEKRLKLVIREFPEIFYDTDTDIIKQKVLSIDGIGDILANQFVENLPHFLEFLTEIGKESLTYIVESENKQEKAKKQKLKDEVLVFSGFRSESLENLVSSLGGRVVSAMSGKVTMVVYSGDKGQSKLSKAKEKGLKLITREKFLEKYKE